MKSILLVADQAGWVFDRHCHEIQKRLPEYKIDIAYHRENIAARSNNYDLVYALDPMIMSYPPPSKTIIGLRCEFLFREHPQGVKGLYERGFPGRCVSIKDKCSIFHVVNKNQFNAFKDIVTDKPFFLAQHGIDEEIFVREKYSKVKHEKLVVSVSGRGSENKGFHLVQEACKKTDCVLVAAQYGRGQVSKDLMPKYYSSVDVHICMSRTEGLSNPIMEAGAMGVSVISTHSGAAEEMITDGVSGYLIDRTVDSLCGALNKIKDDNIREQMGNNLYKEIMSNWIWKVRIEDFRKMFGKFFEK